MEKGAPALTERLPHDTVEAGGGWPMLERIERDQLWYYSALVGFFDGRRPGPLTEDLRRVMGELTRLVAREPPGG